MGANCYKPAEPEWDDTEPVASVAFNPEEDTVLKKAKDITEWKSQLAGSMRDDLIRQKKDELLPSLANDTQLVETIIQQVDEIQKKFTETYNTRNWGELQGLEREFKIKYNEAKEIYKKYTDTPAKMQTMGGAAAAGGTPQSTAIIQQGEQDHLPGAPGADPAPPAHAYPAGGGVPQYQQPQTQQHQPPPNQQQFPPHQQPPTTQQPPPTQQHQPPTTQQPPPTQQHQPPPNQQQFPPHQQPPTTQQSPPTQQNPPPMGGYQPPMGVPPLSSGPAAMGGGHPPRPPGPTGGPPRAPHGGPPPTSAPHGGSPPVGAPHGRPPARSAPHGGSPPMGAPHGGPTQHPPPQNTAPNVQSQQQTPQTQAPLELDPRMTVASKLHNMSRGMNENRVRAALRKEGIEDHYDEMIGILENNQEAYNNAKAAREFGASAAPATNQRSVPPNASGPPPGPGPQAAPATGGAPRAPPGSGPRGSPGPGPAPGVAPRAAPKPKFDLQAAIAGGKNRLHKKEERTQSTASIRPASTSTATTISDSTNSQLFKNISIIGDEMRQNSYMSLENKRSVSTWDNDDDV